MNKNSKVFSNGVFEYNYVYTGFDNGVVTEQVIVHEHSGASPGAVIVM